MPERPATAARVLVVGDVNPDLLLRGDVTPAFGQREKLLDGAELVIGGSAGITAHGLARLGRAVALVAAVGADSLGAAQRRDLAASGVDVTPLIERADIATGVTVVLSRGDDRAILTFPGTIPTLTAAEVEAAVAATGAGHVHVASLYLQPQLAPHLPEVLRKARANGCTVSLDTNDDPAATWRGTDELLPHVDILLPNRNEVLALAGATTDDPQLAARQLARRGPLVVVKDGAAGAFAVSPDGTVESVRGLDIAVVDSTGAGDSFDAAFLDAWLDGAPLAACLEAAVRAGACCVGAVGGTAGQPTREQLRPTLPIEHPRRPA
jgi:sugar/nucleoside kinase (ribokinase family)